MVPPREEIKLGGSKFVVKQDICMYEPELVRYLKHYDHIPHALGKIKQYAASWLSAISRCIHFSDPLRRVVSRDPYPTVGQSV